MSELKNYEITITVSTINQVKAKECCKYMLEGLDKRNIWYSRKYGLKEVN